MKKVPLTARIDPTISAKLTAMQETTGKDRTACLEAALNYFFTNCPDYSAVQPPVNQELVQALREALQSPEIQRVIQTCITQEKPVIRSCDTAGKAEKKKNVSQPRITASRPRITEDGARELVESVRAIQEREGCNVNVACEKLGISNKKYYNRVHFLEGL